MEGWYRGRGQETGKAFFITSKNGKPFREKGDGRVRLNISSCAGQKGPVRWRRNNYENRPGNPKGQN